MVKRRAITVRRGNILVTFPLTGPEPTVSSGKVHATKETDKGEERIHVQATDVVGYIDQNGNPHTPSGR